MHKAMDILKSCRESSPNDGSHDLHARCLCAADEIDRLRASLAAVHWRLKFRERIDSHTISSVIAECEHAVPVLIGIESPNV